MPFLNLKRQFWGLNSLRLTWKLADPVVADSVAQDNAKRNNIQIYTGKILLKHTEGGDKTSQYSYLVELSPRQLGLPVADLSASLPENNKMKKRDFSRKVSPSCAFNSTK